MNIVGRFVAYKAMNAIWNSSARRSNTHSAGAKSKPLTQTEIRRANRAFLGAGLTILLSFGACAVGKFGIGLALFWIGAPIALIAIALLPDRWFGNRNRHKEAEAAQMALRNVANSNGGPINTTASKRSSHLQLLNKLRDLTPEEFGQDMTRARQTADWTPEIKDAYVQVVKERLYILYGEDSKHPWIDYYREINGLSVDAPIQGSQPKMSPPLSSTQKDAKKSELNSASPNRKAAETISSGKQDARTATCDATNGSAGKAPRKRTPWRLVQLNLIRGMPPEEFGQRLRRTQKTAHWTPEIKNAFAQVASERLGEHGTGNLWAGYQRQIRDHPAHGYGVCDHCGFNGIFGRVIHVDQKHPAHVQGEQASNADPMPDKPATGKPYVVYFIQETDGGGECKVGITHSLQSRLRSLQTGNPHTLKTVHTIPVDNKAAAEQIEEAVLNAVRNAGAEMRGEWFQSAILPWAKQVAETEQKRIENGF